jgi:hypothetical protein
MAEQSYTPKKYVDFISDFDNGMNSGLSPLLLKKNQLSVAINISLRDGFAHPRPPFIKRTLNFNGNSALQNLVNTGLFQSAGYYRPDFGSEKLLASIGGHLISFSESGYGGVWNVADVSVSGDPNSASQAQAWMWQAEKWMILGDGSGALPVFFDGITSRRSYGDTQLLGTGIAFSPSSPPAIGDTVEVTLNGPYNGPYNVPVIFNGEFYQLVQSSSGYLSALTNVSDTPGNSQAANSNVVYNPQIACVDAEDDQIVVESTGFGEFPFLADSVAGLVVGQNISLTAAGFNWVFKITQIGFGFPNQVQSTMVSGAPPPPEFSQSYTVPAGTIIYFQGNTSPSVLVGTTQEVFQAPAQGTAINVPLSGPYTGPDNERVTINGAVYTIAAVQGAIGATQIFLINGSDTGTDPYVNPSTIMSVPELFAGRMGCYGMGRNWFSAVNGTQYYAGDIVGGGSGTAAYNYRDAVLKMTENDFLSGGGAFNLPGTGDVISAMIFPPVLDTSLGVGSLQIFTPFSVFANNAPADRTTWTNLTWPIQTESLKDQGALGQDSTFLINSDVFFRSDFSVCSLVLARRQFQLNQWGNKPVGDEMQRFLQSDNQALLPYGSGLSFDNRGLMTIGPVQGKTGVSHPAMISLNLDKMSSLLQNVPPAWEGAFEGLNILKLVTGRVNGLRRCFAFTANLLNNQLELYELLAEAVAMQQGSVADNNATPITWMFETAAMFNEDVHPLNELLQLRDGEIYISDLTGTAMIQVYYRPDFYECWTLWNSFTVCSNISNPNASYRMRVGLGEPSSQPVESGNGRPLRQGYFFQFRFVITGYCTFNGMRVSAISVAQPVFAPVGASSACDSVNCATVPDLQIYTLQSPPYQPPAPPPPMIPNEPVYFSIATICATMDNPGTPCISGIFTLPGWITLTGPAVNVDTSTLTYTGTPQGSATLACTPGSVFYILPGPNEQGVTLINGEQNLILQTGVPVLFTAQTSQLVFQISNLVPTGQLYPLTLNNLSATLQYNLVWGANEASVFLISFVTRLTNPGVGQTTVLIAGACADGVIFQPNNGNGTPVTAQFYAVSPLPFTGIVQVGTALSDFVFTGAAGTFTGPNQQAANSRAQFELNNFIITNYNEGNIFCCF